MHGAAGAANGERTDARDKETTTTTTMNSADYAETLSALMRELVDGSPDPAAGTYMLNRGDEGLLTSLDRLSAAAASASIAGGGSIAAHTDHIRYGLALLNRWTRGEAEPWKGADWTQSWKRPVVSEGEWRDLRGGLRRETHDWIDALATPREMRGAALMWVTGSVAHLAYHLGAIRQIDRAARGPTAEDERRVEETLRSNS